MLVNGERLEADPSGALWWPSGRLLAVADLHLEKGSALAARGSLLPPYDSRATLERLQAVVDRRQPRIVVCLGDSFHDREGAGRLDGTERRLLARAMAGREWLWVLGNHDPAPPIGLGGGSVAEAHFGGLRLCHAGLPGGPAGQVSGHLHPKAAVALRGRRLVRRCFVDDGVRAVLPAFGAYAGGLDVLSTAFAALFPGDFEARLLGRSAVHAVPRRHLVPVLHRPTPAAPPGRRAV